MSSSLTHLAGNIDAKVKRHFCQSCGTQLVSLHVLASSSTSNSGLFFTFKFGHFGMCFLTYLFVKPQIDPNLFCTMKAQAT